MADTFETLKVLVVDDITSARRVVVRVLTQLGVKHTVEARGGSEALALLRGDQFHLIISDWQMPDLSGVDLLRAVRSDPGLSAIPFIMLTSESERERVREAAVAGVNDYIVKPISLQTLSEKIRALCDRRVAETR